MDKQLEDRLKGLEDQLKRFVDVMENALGRDLARPINAVRDGYYEAALTNAGSIIEAMLRDIWQREVIKGEGKKKTIEQLFSVVKEQAQMDRLVQDYIRDIQLVRNRAAHGEEIVAEDCLEALRKLAVILEWYFEKYVLGGEPVEAATPEEVEDEPPERRIPWSRVALLALLTLVILGAVLVKVGQHRREALRKAQAEYRMVIAPFDAATDAARDEAVTMRQLLYAALAEVLEEERGVRVMTPDADLPPRTDGEARDFGEQHLADVTIWGRVVSVGGETVIEPHIAAAPIGDKEWTYRPPFGGFADLIGSQPQALATQQASADELKLRMAKAEEIRDLALVLAATRYFESTLRHQDALRILRPFTSAESLYQQGRIMLSWGIDEQAGLELIRQALAKAPDHVAARVQLVRHAILESRDYSRALELCENRDFSSSEGWWLCIAAYDHFGREGDGDAILQSIISSNSVDRWVAAASYSARLFRSGRTDEGLEILRSYPDDAPGSTQIRVRLAERCDCLGHTAEALDVLSDIPYPEDSWDHYWSWNMREPFFVLLDHGLHDQASDLLEMMEARLKSRSPFFDERIRLACAQGNLPEAHEVIDEALRDYFWRFGKRRWLTWHAWKEPVLAALGLRRTVQGEIDEQWQRVDFNPDVAQEWRAYLHLFEDDAPATVEYLGQKNDEELVNWIWGWHSYPKAIAAYLADHPESARQILTTSRNAGWDFPGLSLLVLSETASRSEISESLEEFRHTSPGQDAWLRREWFGRFVAGELAEEEIWTDSYCGNAGSWNIPDWTLDTGLDLGAYFLATGDTEKARDYLQRAVDTDLRYEIEWLLAKHALENIEVE
jgi:tetratricopeptide (TPR) repeat protein